MQYYVHFHIGFMYVLLNFMNVKKIFAVHIDKIDQWQYNIYCRSNFVRPQYLVF